jgi:hypothetical protein
MKNGLAEVYIRKPCFFQERSDFIRRIESGCLIKNVLVFMPQVLFPEGALLIDKSDYYKTPGLNYPVSFL